MRKQGAQRSGWVYILRCSNGGYYTGSTVNLDRRMREHWSGKGANYTRKNPPVCLVYAQLYAHIATAFKREKQIQGWSRKKKEVLMKGDMEELKRLAQCQNNSRSGGELE